MAVTGFGKRIRRVGIAAATVMGLVVLAAACTDPGTWNDTAPESVGFVYYASNVFDSACAGPDACVVVGNNAATVWDGTAWTETVVPSFVTFGFVTCGAPGLCLANPSRTSDGAVVPVSRLDGTRWVPVADPTGTLEGATVTDASCAGPSFCMAAVARSGVAGLARWDGQAWTGTPTTTPPGGVLHVDCATPDFCMATATVGGSLAAYTWDGRAWSDAPKPPVGSGPLSCGAPGTCLALGTDPVGGTQRLAAWDGAAWSLAPMPPGRIQALDCASATSCMAVTQAPDATPYVLEDGAWRSAPVPATVPAATLISVACGAEDACLATGTRPDGGVTHRAAAFWDGDSWTGQPDLPRPTRPWGRLQSVACPTDAWCATVGIAKAGAQNVAAPVAQVRQGTKRWAVTPVPAGLVPDNEAPLDISCASETFCVVVSLSGGSGARDKALQWDGQAWKTVDLRPALGTGRGPTKVSCPSTTFCLAVGGSTALRFDGTTWQAAPTPAGSSWDVDCLSATLCRATGRIIAAAGQTGTINTWDGTTWVQELLPLIQGLSPGGENISCLDADHCIVSGKVGAPLGPLVLTWNGLLWTATPVAPDRSDDIAAAACADAKRCVAVTTSGGRQQSVGLVTGDVSTGSWAPTQALPHGDGLVVMTTALTCRPQYCLTVGSQNDGLGERAYAAALYLGKPA